MNALNCMQATAFLARFTDALGTLPLGGPVIGPQFGQMVGPVVGGVLCYTTLTKTALGQRPVMVVTASAFGVPHTPVVSFGLN